MKKPFLLFLLLLIVKLSFSQVIIGLIFGDKLNQGPIEFGLDLSYNSSTLTNIQDPRRMPRIGFGLYMTHNMRQNMGFDYGLFFNSPKGSRGLAEEDMLYEIPGLLEGEQIERRLNYVEIPVEYFYAFNQRFSVSAGGYVAYLHGSSDRVVTDINGGKNYYDKPVTENFNPLDAGVSIHLKYHFFGQPGAQLKFGYSRGLVDIYKSGDIEGYNDVIRFSVLIPIKFGI